MVELGLQNASLSNTYHLPMASLPKISPKKKRDLFGKQIPTTRRVAGFEPKRLLSAVVVAWKKVHGREPGNVNRRVEVSKGRHEVDVFCDKSLRSNPRFTS